MVRTSRSPTSAVSPPPSPRARASGSGICRRLTIARKSCRVGSGSPREHGGGTRIGQIADLTGIESLPIRAGDGHDIFLPDALDSGPMRRRCLAPVGESFGLPVELFGLYTGIARSESRSNQKRHRRFKAMRLVPPSEGIRCPQWRAEAQHKSEIVALRRDYFRM